jgi:hypothetical protein
MAGTAPAPTWKEQHMDRRTAARRLTAAAAAAALLGTAGLAAAGPASAAAAAPRAAVPGPVGWGNNDLGQIGDGTTKEKDSAEQISLSGTPVQVTSAFGVTGAALLSNGTVETWGNDFQGQLGTGSGSGAASDPEPAVVPGLSGITPARRRRRLLPGADLVRHRLVLGK